MWQIWRDFLHLLYPKRCPICDRVLAVRQEADFSAGSRRIRIKPGSYYPLCPQCRTQVDWVKEPVCKICGKPLENQEQELCVNCETHSHAYRQGKALWVYRGPVKESVYRLKYSNRREYAISYAQELARVYGGWIEEKGVEALVPIPLHPKRQRRRGYNQAQLIARELGRLLDIPVETKLLKRVINTRPQKELNDKERKNNLKKAFKICTNDVQLNQVLLVDDIYTTGSTMDGAAEELKKAGVGNVYVVSACIGRGY